VDEVNAHTFHSSTSRSFSTLDNDSALSAPELMRWIFLSLSAASSFFSSILSRFLSARDDPHGCSAKHIPKQSQKHTRHVIISTIMNKSGDPGNKADIQIDVDDQSLYDKASIKLTKRYCWGRLSKVQFIIVISLVTFISLFLIALAVGYIFIIPGLKQTSD
jgi:hypothetical protein